MALNIIYWIRRVNRESVLYPGAKIEGVVNFFDPKAVDWWWENGVMKVASIGAKFVKTDVGGTMDLKGLHNIFPLAYAEAPYRKFQEYNNMRGVTHTREGYAGIQRYPYIWAGDWGSEWQWFEPVIRAGLNIGMSGVGNWTHCMGGFEQYSPYDTELYTRWVQFGMFSPIAWCSVWITPVIMNLGLMVRRLWPILSSTIVCVIH